MPWTTCWDGALDMLNDCCALRPNPQENNGMATIPALVLATRTGPQPHKGTKAKLVLWFKCLKPGWLQ